MAVGNYTSPAGRSLPFSAHWINGTWHLAKAPVIAGEAATYFQAVSCSAATACIAVGNAATPGTTAFAEQYASGKWAIMPTVPKTGSGFWSVSCPALNYCAAAGTHGRKSLLEAWNGTAWATQTVPATPAPFTSNTTFHVSCINSTLCYAVGYQHNPANRHSYKTLALQWNGTTWTVMNTHNH
jgi:hypothetical protein